MALNYNSSLGLLRIQCSSDVIKLNPSSNKVYFATSPFGFKVLYGDGYVFVMMP
jgi:hypothetical protein